MRIFRLTTLHPVALPYGDAMSRTRDLVDDDNCRLTIEQGMVFARGPRVVIIPLSNVACMETVRAASIAPPDMDTEPGIPSKRRKH